MGNKPKSRTRLVLLVVAPILPCVLYAVLIIPYFRARDSSSVDDDEELRRAACIGYCESVLADPKASRFCKSLAREALQKWANERVDPEPILVHLMLLDAEPERGKPFSLGLGVSDEDNDMAGIGVREEHIDSNGQVMVIEEEYPVFGYQSVGSLQMIRVKIREHGERKNHQVWQEYLDMEGWRGDAMPDLWVSKPDPGKVEVKIWLYDHAGHKSELVPLE